MVLINERGKPWGKELEYYSERKGIYLEVYLLSIISIGHPGPDLERAER